LFRGHIKVTSTIALHLTLNISETVRDRGCSKGLPIGNYIWAILKGRARDHNTLRAQYLENP